jgi:hypothetical protein
MLPPTCDGDVEGDPEVMTMSRLVRVGILGGAVIGLYAAAIRPRQLMWGATPDEVDAELPGDGLVSDADLISTRCIDIDADPRDVWPWVVQMGQGRAGLYTYDALENLVGCDIHSADRIVPEWQDVEVGDTFRLHPEVGLAVAEVRPGEALVLLGAVPAGGTEGQAPYDFSWAFVLRDGKAGGTRLIVRERYGYTRWWAPLLVEPVEAVSFLMTQKMLRGIRDRAERQVRSELVV